MNLIPRVFAQEGAENVDADDLNVGLLGDSNLTDLLQTVVGWILIIAGVLAFVYLLYSGILYITAGGNAEQAKKGQQGILNAIIGVIIIFLSYAIIRAIIQQIEPS